MRVMVRSGDSVTVELGNYECDMIAAALEQAVLRGGGAGGGGEGDEAFARRFGWPYPGAAPTREELRAIRRRVPTWLGDDDPEALYSEPFTRRELLILLRSLSEMADGVDIPDWQFEAHTGVGRFEVRELVEEVRRILTGAAE
jgi:hypothetical protein